MTDAALSKATREPLVGEAWAYRARSTDPLVQVVVLRMGVKTPQRVLIRFVVDEFEGRQDWAPPARLKVPWREVEAFIDRELRWSGVLATSPPLDSPEEMAVSVVFDDLIDPALATLGFNAANGTITIGDLEGLAAYLDLGADELRADSSCFEEEGNLIAPWPTALLIARRAAERDPEAILGHVEREEAEARRDAIHGRHYPGRGKKGGWSVTPEICAQVDEEHGRPIRAILRDWCGAEAVGVRSELGELRKEVLRLTKLVESSVEALRQAGARREAERIEGELAGRSTAPMRRSPRRAGGPIP
jgi:hypothetical protein